MNSQNKIYNFEVIPPAGVWNQIAKELDQLDSLKPLSQKLNNLQVSPPENLWQRVAQKLDEADQEKNINQKLYDLEVEPPEMVWGNIANHLDDQQALDIIERKLKDIQVQPPASIWNSIERKLNNPTQVEDHKGLVVPMHHHSWLKYAAAACFIAIISVTAYFIFNDGNGNGNMGLANNSSNNSAIPPTLVINNNEGTLDNSIKSTSSQKQQVMAAISTKLGNVYSISNEQNAELQNRYIVLMTPDGNIVRMSKKLGNMADCIAGEDNSCNEQISEWQKEMASNTTIASPDNFLGILEMAANEESSN